MTRLTLAAFGGAVAVVLGLVEPRAQVPAPSQNPPTFHSTTRLVEVDVMVRDDRDHFVLGLTADDLDIYEEGVLQRIQQIYLVTTDPVTGVLSTDGIASNAADIRSHRLFVLLFDENDLETGALLRIKNGAERFLTEQFKEGDVGGVVVGGKLYQGKLTNSRATLLAGVRSVRPAFDSRESRLRGFREFPRIPGEAEAVRITSGDRFLIQSLGEDACRDDPHACSLEGGLQQVENKLQQKARNYVGQSRDATRYTLESLQTVANSLAQLPGRKTVVFFSDGFFIEESKGRVQQLAGIAARAGATIYAIDGRGQMSGRTPQPDVSSRERPLESTFDTNGDGPAMLADGTGGLVMRQAEDVSRALAIIARDTSTYYVVGYQPRNSVMDGKFRKIQVKAKNSALTIRARSGYVASPLPPLVTGR